MMRYIAIVTVFIMAADFSVAAESVRMKDGEVIDGKIEKEDKKIILMKPKSGEAKEINRSEIDEIKYTPEPVAKADKLRAENTRPAPKKAASAQALPLEIGGYYRFETKDGMTISNGKLISESDDTYWVMPVQQDADSYMIAVQKADLLNRPDKPSESYERSRSAGKNADRIWTSGRISLTQSLMRDMGSLKLGPNGQRDISAVSTILAYDHSLAGYMKNPNIFIPGIRLEGAVTRMTSLTQRIVPGDSVLRPVSLCCNNTASDYESSIQYAGMALSGGQIHAGLIWLFRPFANHQFLLAPQAGISILSSEISSTAVNGIFTVTGVAGYEYVLGPLSLAFQVRASYLDFSAIALLGGGIGAVYHLSP